MPFTHSSTMQRLGQSWKVLSERLVLVPCRLLELQISGSLVCCPNLSLPIPSPRNLSLPIPSPRSLSLPIPSPRNLSLPIPSPRYLSLPSFASLSLPPIPSPSLSLPPIPSPCYLSLPSVASLSLPPIPVDTLSTPSLPVALPNPAPFPSPSHSPLPSRRPLSLRSLPVALDAVVALLHTPPITHPIVFPLATKCLPVPHRSCSAMPLCTLPPSPPITHIIARALHLTSSFPIPLPSFSFRDFCSFISFILQSFPSPYLSRLTPP
ncbi:unnamed protein product [Closterium sp. Yama58-4]|nr:unnamed protein product [Closterium sp. Yama58-4]